MKTAVSDLTFLILYQNLSKFSSSFFFLIFFSFSFDFFFFQIVIIVSAIAMCEAFYLVYPTSSYYVPFFGYYPVFLRPQSVATS